MLTHMQNLKYNTNGHIYERETDSQTQRTDLWLPTGMGVGEGSIESFGLADATIIYRTDKQQGPTEQHRELYSISWDKP